MAEKLGLNGEVKEVKLGKSFTKDANPYFHTFRYDFMPASIDMTQQATVDIGEGHQVTVTMPHVEGSGTANTVFKGSKKPYQKECVFIIDHTTGEITLEKLTYNIQLKKTRAEGSSRIRPPTTNGINNLVGEKKSPSGKKRKQHLVSISNSPVRRCSPLPRSPINGDLNANNPSTSSAVQKPYMPRALNTTAASAVTAMDTSDAPEIGLLSSSCASSSEDSYNSGSDNENIPSSTTADLPKVPGGSLCQPMDIGGSSFSLPSMPKFSQLSEDLKLSESDSD